MYKKTIFNYNKALKKYDFVLKMRSKVVANPQGKGKDKMEAEKEVEKKTEEKTEKKTKRKHSIELASKIVKKSTQRFRPFSISYQQKISRSKTSIPKTVFQRLVRETIGNVTHELKNYRVQGEAFSILQQAAEDFLQETMKNGRVILQIRNRVTLCPKDISAGITLTKPHGFQDYILASKSRARKEMMKKIKESDKQSLEEWAKEIQEKC